ncbi:MAG: anti-sigma regulatory factor [Spirulina sp. SIO3F2]|nr:anti-sigma regulatory factor [Spirulina sp. SIO3F2]
MIAIPLPTPKCDWQTIRFPSTLYLCPILDTLLSKVPSKWHLELRLGLQEALVNAAKHGNKLDPSKEVSVQFSVTQGLYSWVIRDQGDGFKPLCTCPDNPDDLLPEEWSENGRGLCLLYKIFDQVHWNETGTELRLCKFDSREC